MLAKVVKGGIVVLLAATLIGGTIYILARPSEAQEVGRSGSAQVANPAINEGGGRGYGASQEASKATGREVRGEAGRGEAASAAGVAAASTAAEWLTIDGDVLALTEDELTIGTAEGELVTHLGPEWYWESEGIALNVGDEVELTGFYEGDRFEAAGIVNSTTGESVVLRDTSGRPMWAGRGGQGRGAQGRNGQGL